MQIMGHGVNIRVVIVWVAALFAVDSLQLKLAQQPSTNTHLHTNICYSGIVTVFQKGKRRTSIFTDRSTHFLHVQETETKATVKTDNHGTCTEICQFVRSFQLYYMLFLCVDLFEPCHEKTSVLHYAKTKTQISLAITAFVFTTLLVQFVYFVNPK